MQKPLSQIQRSTLTSFQQTFNSHSFGGFGLKEETIRDLLLIAAGCLMYSYGFVTQLMDMLPVGIMNKLEGKIAEIRYE